MNIIPVLRCRDINESVVFYTQVLDFVVLNPGESEFPYRLLAREGARLDISALSGDGVFGACVLIEVDDVDQLFQKFIARGLDVSNKGGVHRKPTDQTWGMREFYVEDPNRNTLRFGQEIT
jgi:catechol 2,3-dioxygenase-like lactoylglutathione lyase family enzyme